MRGCRTHQTEPSPLYETTSHRSVRGEGRFQCKRHRRPRGRAVAAFSRLILSMHGTSETVAHKRISPRLPNRQREGQAVSVSELVHLYLTVWGISVFPRDRVASGLDFASCCKKLWHYPSRKSSFGCAAEHGILAWKLGNLRNRQSPSHLCSCGCLLCGHHFLFAL